MNTPTTPPHIDVARNYSHILNIVSSHSTPNEIATQIHQRVFDKINNTPIKFIIQNMDIVITWHSSNNIPNCYHADVMGMFGDAAVDLHTKLLADELGMPILDFMVTKPMVRTIPLCVTNIG